MEGTIGYFSPADSQEEEAFSLPDPATGVHGSFPPPPVSLVSINRGERAGGGDLVDAGGAACRGAGGRGGMEGDRVFRDERKESEVYLFCKGSLFSNRVGRSA